MNKNNNDRDNLSFTQSLRNKGEIITDNTPVLVNNSLQTQQMKLPVLMIPNTILLPHTHMTIRLDKPHTEEMLKSINEEQQGVIVTPLAPPTPEGEIEFHTIGTILQVDSLEETPADYKLELHVKDKIKVNDIIEEDKHYYALFETITETDNITPEEANEIHKNLDKLIFDITSIIPNAEGYAQKITENKDLQEKIAEIFQYLRVSLNKKQELLEINSIKLRALEITKLLIEQRDSMKIQMEIAKKLNQNMNEVHKQTMLREQMKIIQEELSQEEGSPNKKTYRERIEEAELPEEVEEVAFEELAKLERQGQNNSEENIIRNYLDTILNLPWHKEEKHPIDIEKAKEQLNKDHYGLKKVKDRIIQHLTVMEMKNEKQGSILLFLGPPGTGKTSLGKSIATALNRPYIRASLGGVKDESEIRGHRRTYLGALPGRIINGMKKSGQTNPVFVLDEIDKLTESINGNPTSALLEVLDPEQNDTFSDHYLEVPYDLSDVFFIATANSLQGIPKPLQDRLEIIELDSYTNNEKQHIAKEHLIKEVLDDHGLTEDQLQITPEAINMIIEKYTREAGVRELKRQIAAIARKTTEKIVVEKIDTPYIVTEDMLYDILGREKAHYEQVKDQNPPGVVTGLAWTPVGGDILYIEAIMMPGDEKLKLTGQLGDVMKESAQIAQSLIKSRLTLPLQNTDFKDKDIHIHVPEGSIPKDGPSAGVTILTTIASLITGQPVDSKLAMTGEISLRGAVLPVGGIKEKVIAAHRSGIKRILLPRENIKDLDDVPKEVKDEMTFEPLDTIEDVLDKALGLKLPKPEQLNITVSQINTIRN